MERYTSHFSLRNNYREGFRYNFALALYLLTSAPNIETGGPETSAAVHCHMAQEPRNRLTMRLECLGNGVRTGVSCLRRQGLVVGCRELEH
jgi:hypothetical protein